MRPKVSSTASAGKPVIVTTAHKGVFFGYASDTTGETITLRNGRNCIYWSAAMKGFMGLAAYGPDKDCKIGPPADITLRNITAVIEVPVESVAKWEKAPWS